MIDGRRLRAYRERAALTQTELAKRVGIAQTYYSRIERGASSASQETLQAIIQVLNISIGDIWDDENTLSVSEPSTHPTQGIIIEHGTGRGRRRYILPPTPDSYAFLEKQMGEEPNDLKRRAFILLWDAADKDTRERAFKILSGDEQEDK